MDPLAQYDHTRHLSDYFPVSPHACRTPADGLVIHQFQGAFLVCKRAHGMLSFVKKEGTEPEAETWIRDHQPGELP